MMLYGEDYDSIACLEEFRTIISNFQQLEGLNLSEWEIKAKSGIKIENIRQLQQVFCRFYNLPKPTPIIKYDNSIYKSTYLYKPRFPLLVLDGD